MMQRRWITILIVALTGLGGWWAGTALAEEPEDTEAAPPRRVIVHMDRYTRVPGVVELEDDGVLVIRTPQDELQSFVKSRILHVIKLVDPQPDQEGVVWLVNGARRDGVILEDHYDYVLMEIEGVRAKLLRESVDHVQLSPTFDEQYFAYKEHLKPGMTDRHLALCRWLMEKDRYALAETELIELLTHDESADARLLLRVVQAQLALDAPRPRPREDGLDDDATEDEDPPKLLTEDDVNIIRVYEIDFDDPPKLAVSKETVETIIRDYAENPLLPASQTERAALYRARPIQIAALLFNLRARELYDEIDVLSEPPALNQFRRRVHDTWLIKTCSTTKCHGGSDSGRFFLHRRDYKKEPVRYTNLLILERMKLDEDWPLIDYHTPRDSLIIQYGLPRNLARKPHPDVKGWRPAFRTVEDRLVEEAVRWLEMMYQPRPAYPVDYAPPEREPLTAPPPPPSPPPGEADPDGESLGEDAEAPPRKPR